MKDKQGVQCECGWFEPFTAWVMAHWDINSEFACPKCDRRYIIFQGIAKKDFEKSKEVYEKQNECPKCKSKNLSDGISDFLYDKGRGKEVPIQFCNDCHTEWFIEPSHSCPNQKVVKKDE